MNADHLSGFADHYNQEARLIILKALAEQHDWTLPENILLKTLQAFGINKGKPYVRNQVNWLADNASAVTSRTIATAVIVTITEAGLDHVERRNVLEGVARPSPPRA